MELTPEFRESVPKKTLKNSRSRVSIATVSFSDQIQDNTTAWRTVERSAYLVFGSLRVLQQTIAAKLHRVFASDVMVSAQRS